MSAGSRSRVLLVARGGAAGDHVQSALAPAGLDVARVAPEQAAASTRAEGLLGAVVLLERPGDSSIAAILAAHANLPVLALEVPAGIDPSSLASTARAFAQQLAARGEARGPLSSLRIALFTEHWDKSEALVPALRAQGATVATAEPGGIGLAAARAIEPQVALLDVPLAEEDALVARLARDPVLGWTVLLPFEWEVLNDAGGAPRVGALARVVDAWLGPERDLVRGVATDGNATSTIESVGVGRFVRALAGVDAPVRIHLQSVGVRGEIDLASSMLAGARVFEGTSETPELEGPHALACLLRLEDATIHAERFDGPMPANIGLDVGDGLKQARLLADTITEEMPTDPSVIAWKKRRSSEGSSTVPSVRLMLGALAASAPAPSADVTSPMPAVDPSAVESSAVESSAAESSAADADVTAPTPALVIEDSPSRPPPLPSRVAVAPLPPPLPPPASTAQPSTAQPQAQRPPQLPPVSQADLRPP
ncbi:MAG: hypothetical protein IT378_14160, partial [Sandaracinaceae bacterium]|nr:hypothetical protein [Sandaracinaceae bacterium]